MEKILKLIRMNKTQKMTSTSSRNNCPPNICFNKINSSSSSSNQGTITNTWPFTHEQKHKILPQTFLKPKLLTLYQFTRSSRKLILKESKMTILNRENKIRIIKLISTCNRRYLNISPKTTASKNPLRITRDMTAAALVVQ